MASVFSIICCKAETAIEFPDNWGANADDDLAFIEANDDAKVAVKCVCEKCGDFPEVKMFPANADDAMCKLVGAEGKALNLFCTALHFLVCGICNATPI